MSDNSISSELRILVRERAKICCEYCLIPQDFSIYTHEIDHIIALKHGGKTTPENLALSCLFCNRHKGSDFATIDIVSGKITRLFNPRQQVWQENFEENNGYIEGISEIGIATARLLKFNTPNRIIQRQLLIRQGLSLWK